MPRARTGITTAFLLLCATGGAFADETPLEVTTSVAAPAFVGADIAWMLVSSALVLMMTAPGLAMFYGGLVRKKNILSVMMQCIFLMGIMSLVWAGWGYSLAFSGDVGGGLIGNLDYAFLNGVMSEWKDGAVFIPAEGTIPKSLHMVFQMMFFIITPALICGAFAERMKFSAMVLFCVLWGTFVYCPVAHWVWSVDGWCSEFNPDAKYKAFDFAGGTVVHITSGFSALVCALLLGRRLGFGQEPMPPHNLTYTCIGAALLWVGWFGFNAGSALMADGKAVNAFVATHMAASAGVVAWAGIEWIMRGKASILGACSGAVAGLVCITPASGSVTPISAIVLGFAAGLICFWACTSLKNRFKYDDSLDAFGVHGVGGTVGALLTGVFATPAVTGDAAKAGLLYGNAQQMVAQVVGIGAAIALAVVGTVILLKILDATIGLRVSQAGELQGLDINEHGEEGYIFL
ncbi:ammonium transporter [Planctellipticum variicoloris]|uniref:ammonium transporter n=1 Tax=Planctellipticum variicoloris TaxID=3064265 RepID=UPI003AF507E4